MSDPHRHHVAPVAISDNLAELGVSNLPVQASCYHHQVIKVLGKGVTPIAFAAEGHVEAVKYESAAWAYGLQWHPEDNYDDDSAQLQIVRKFIEAAGR
jgi:putative glutamine amidotransferase